MKIFTIADKKEEKFLRTKTADFDFSKNGKKDIDELIKKMKNAMLKANGIGLSANQIGLDIKMFVCRIPKIKSHVIFNPKITKFSDKKTIMEEGCLSVPGLYGLVERPESVALKGYNRYAKPITVKADGLLARVFQHEIDHLNGILFIDKAKKLYKLESIMNNLKI
ncbi:MAG: peptide deformylase [Patescibacteria group bacterium]